MKLSKKSRYGLRALIDLAVNSRTELVSLGSIAQRNDISAQYLEHVFSALRKSHIVKSMKGSQGGYFLERDPKEITVAQIVEALEGTYDLEDEVDRNRVERGDQEAIQHLIIDRINDCVQEILEDVTLKDLVDAYEGYQDSVEGMYYI
ncbi:HTH-type transcriptional regulator CymR [[Ruminococcus] torques]|uniref:HTH-type transcriptional regulator CymR n=1 Tax=[Ruminococcus] torques TaxID=33039 RepID=A0A564U6P4_9FIRM|nr:Rrf2 family transcriptional regulator [[Ruminococcus] torques]VUX15186.1 HTH-type transcriptional regulator CymR [[Ruminococcus] torques]